MYGLYGMYSGNKCNFSSSTMYKPAGVVTMTSGYKMSGNGLNRSGNGGIPTSLPSNSYTGVIIEMAQKTSLQQLTNVSPGAQHIDYQQNPSPILISVRQPDVTNPQEPSIYPDKESVGTYALQYTIPGIAHPLSSNTPQQTTIYEQQNL